jgi:hypothetical protein
MLAQILQAAEERLGIVAKPQVATGASAGPAAVLTPSTKTGSATA